VAYVTGTEWVSGGSDGGLSLWSQMKKKPVSVVRHAHSTAAAAAAADAGGDAASWIAAVASCRGSDLVVSSHLLDTSTQSAHMCSADTKQLSCFGSSAICAPPAATSPAGVGRARRAAPPAPRRATTRWSAVSQLG